MSASETPAAQVFRLRCDLKLSQEAFADRFGLTASTVKNIEQGRGVSSSLRLVLAAIEVDAAVVQKAAQMVGRAGK